MRVVRSPGSRRSPEERRSRAPLLESVRYLGERFPRAGLRSVTLVRAPDLDAAPRVRVSLALESMQVTGSFKVRGAFAALGALARRHPGSPPRVVAASAGNHGAGVSHAARVLGAEATIVMPKNVPEAKRARVADAGAEVVLAETDHYDDAEALAQSLARDRGMAFLSPYDDLDVLAGNGGSLAFEIGRALGKLPALVLAPFGGGGLATGLSWALFHEARGNERAAVWGAQSEASPAMALSLERGEAVVRLALDEPTLAEGLEGGISAAAYARAREAVDGILVVSEEDIARAMVYAYRQMGLVVEGSAAAALAPLLRGLPPAVLPEGEAAVIDVVAVLTGRNVDPERLARVLAEAGAPAQ